MNEKSKKFALIGDMAGLLGFVGLIVPHIMRGVTGQESRPFLAASPAVSWSAIRLPSSCWGAER